MSHETNPREAAAKRSLAEKLRRAEKAARERAIREREKFRGLQIRPTASFFDDADSKEPGEDNWSGYGFDLHPHVTMASTAVLTTFIVLTLMFQKQAAAFAEDTLAWVSGSFGWFFILAANVFIGAALFSPSAGSGPSASAATRRSRNSAPPPGTPCCSAPGWASA